MGLFGSDNNIFSLKCKIDIVVKITCAAKFQKMQTYAVKTLLHAIQMYLLLI